MPTGALRLLTAEVLIAAAPPAALSLAASAAFSRQSALAPHAAPRLPHAPTQAFVHLFEWSWDDIAQECEDWLGPKGFAAVQVSPPTEHIQGPQWWTRYQPVSYNLTSRSGGESAFVSMVQRCRAAGVDVYVDAVFNHCAAGSGVGVAGSRFGDRRYPLFDPTDFHHDEHSTQSNCILTNYSNRHDVQYCDLLTMPDLCTGCERVQAVVATFLNRLAALGVAGIRIDAAKHQNPDELAALLSKVDGRLWRFSEVVHGDGDPTYEEEYAPFSQVTEFRYAKGLDYALDRIVDGGGSALAALAGYGEGFGLLPSGSAVVFVDNHDTQRPVAQDPTQLTYKSGLMYRLAVAFMLSHPYGYPQLMSSFRFSAFADGPPSGSVHGPAGSVRCGDGQPWVCEHREPIIANMVRWRRVGGDLPLTNFTTDLDGEAVFFCRGGAACIAFNRDEHNAWFFKVQLPLPPGRYCDVAQAAEPSNCSEIVVDSPGALSLLIVPPTGVVALHVGALSGDTAASVRSEWLVGPGG